MMMQVNLTPFALHPTNITMSCPEPCQNELSESNSILAEICASVILPGVQVLQKQRHLSGCQRMWQSWLLSK